MAVCSPGNIEPPGRTECAFPAGTVAFSPGPTRLQLPSMNTSIASSSTS